MSVALVDMMVNADIGAPARFGPNARINPIDVAKLPMVVSVPR